MIIKKVVASKRIKIYASLVGFLFVLLMTGITAASATTIVSISPSTSTVSPGQSFKVNISIEPDTAIAGAQFNLQFDSSIVNVNSVKEGELFLQNGSNTLFNPGTIDNGVVTHVWGNILSTSGVPKDVSTPGTFAIINLTASDTITGSSPLELIGIPPISVKVCDPDGNAVPINVINGTVKVIVNAQEMIIDNGDPGTSYTGTWEVSGGTNPYGTDSLFSRDGATYTWHAYLPQTGVYEVYMWWTVRPSRSTSAPVTIECNGESQGVYVNQSQNGGMWNYLGTYGFDEATEGTVTITAEDSAPSYCADAVKFVYVPGANIPPVATIDSIAPNPAQHGETVTFVSNGTDSDGTVVNYRWRSSLDGELNDSASFSTSALSEGTHTIFLKVQDDSGDWSEEVNETLNIVQVPTEIIIDNDDPGTSYAGTWEVSGGKNPYGTDSLFSRDGATYTWHVDLPQTGAYEVHMWWTEYASRSANAPVTIEYNGGSQVVYVNQQQDGGNWNYLGTYSFDEATEGTVTITAEDSAPSYCADAVKFVYVLGANIPPVATIDFIAPYPTQHGEKVTFAGNGTDSDGTVVNYRWRSSLDGKLNDSASFSTSALSEGTHTIFLKVQDDNGAWSEEVSEDLTIYPEPENQPPVADTNSSFTGTEGVPITFDGSNSSDADGSIVSYVWDFGDGNITTGVTSTYTYAQDGDYTITLTVTDDDGATDTDTTTATIADTGPTADFSTATTSGTEPLTVDFYDNSTSYDGIETWEWDFDNDDVPDSTEQNPTYVYEKEGVYSVSLNVYECNGDSDAMTKSDYVTVTLVNNAPDKPSNPAPYDGATEVPINEAVSWTGGDPDAEDTVTYDVYFGTDTNPQLVSENQMETVYDPGTRNYQTKYYWRIVATDINGDGESAESEVWSFTTAASSGSDFDVYEVFED